MIQLQLPTKIEVQSIEKNKDAIIIEPCEPGYGTTLGNALRRVLLSSLPGAAATSVKIKGATHEFSTIPNVKEDLVEIILNIKTIRFKLHGVPQSKVSVKVKGEKVITAKDISCPSDVEVTTPDVHIATLTDKDAEYDMEIVVEEGRGYVPVETADKKTHELGVITIDAIYTPVKNANFSVEHVRVGQMTNFDKLNMTIATDGSLKPIEALRDAARILTDHFAFITHSGEESKAEQQDEDPETEKKPKKKSTKSKKE